MKKLALLLTLLALAAAPAHADDPATNAPSRSVLANAFADIRAGVAEAAKGGFDFETLDLSARRVLRTCEERPGCFPWDFVRDVRPFGEDAPAKDVFGVVFLGSDDGRPFPGRTIALFRWTSPATTRILRFAGDLTADEPPVHDPLALLYDFAVRRVDLDDDPEHPALRLDGVYVHDDIPAKLDLEIGADGDFVVHEAPRTPAEDLAILRRWCWRVPFVRTTFPEPWQISAVPGYVDRALERLKRGGGDAHVPALALLLLREYDHQIENRNPRYYTNFPCLPWRVVRPLDAWLRDHGATWGADPTSGDLANAVLERREHESHAGLHGDPGSRERMKFAILCIIAQLVLSLLDRTDGTEHVIENVFRHFQIIFPVRVRVGHIERIIQQQDQPVVSLLLFLHGLLSSGILAPQPADDAVVQRHGHVFV